ncbi:MAG: YkvA family protein [Silanimonas sp.]
MSLTLTIELSDRDLEHFTKAIEAARAAASHKPAAEVIAAATALLATAQNTKLPDFIADRLDQLDTLVAMVKDEGWALPATDAQRVTAALAYFADPKDIIPDNVPVLGFLDDAIAIELCVRELGHEFEAYDDFCEYRQAESERRGVQPASVGRAEWLEGRREELQNRMHRRRDREDGQGYGSSSGYGRRSYLKNVWRPSTYVR